MGNEILPSYGGDYDKPFKRMIPIKQPVLFDDFDFKVSSSDFFVKHFHCKEMVDSF